MKNLKDDGGFEGRSADQMTSVRLTARSAHWREMIGDDTKLVRPRQIYVGNPLRQMDADLEVNRTLVI